jgi:hypothetical protein
VRYLLGTYGGRQFQQTVGLPLLLEGTQQPSTRGGRCISEGDKVAKLDKPTASGGGGGYSAAQIKNGRIY